ncbi:MAG: UDP-N-acetylmuramoyl-tripeptide--D-alanyl-D-alanine ligase [Woeseiaceae bacterium]|nr:UDP-N-acetylmuramoyl-tripeptide--D-alanyl-D-alanine ligase [Woeseiaceae bacterium]
MNATLMNVSNAMGGQLVGSDASFNGVSIDSRTIERDQLFFAISGPNFDGHDYVASAAEQGAVAAVVTHECDASINQIIVEDTRAALGRLGTAWRDQFDVVTVGITGSNGKTTLKEMIGACLASRAETLITQGNLNNELGVPLMLLKLNDSHKFGVFEMGANHAGEIAYLTSLVKPQYVVLSNAGPAHLEGFGSLDGVARAKGEIFAGEPRPECAFLNADDHYFEYWQTLVTDIDFVSFGLGEGAHVRATDVELHDRGSRFRLSMATGDVTVELPLPGIHNVRNACAAAAVVHRIGLDADEIASSLATIEAVDGRLKPIPGPEGSRLFDDSYNANPTSVLAAGEYLASLDGDSVMVLGDMLELGPDEAALHTRLGTELREAGIHRVLATGALSKHTVSGFGADAHWFDSVEKLIKALAPTIGKDSNVLVKGSRSMRMERVVEALRSDQEGDS